MFFLRTILKAIPKSLKQFSEVKLIGWLVLLIPVILAFSGIYILDVIGIILCLMFIYFLYLPELKDSYYDLMSDENNFPDGNHTIYPSENNREDFKKVCIVNGKLNGKYSEYVNGKLQYKGTYKNGLKDGSYESYSIPGNYDKKSKRYLAVNGFYKDDKLYGFRKNYFDNGQVSFQSYWQNGIQCGEAITYLKDGTVVRKSDLSKGKVIKSTEFYLNGKVRMINKGTNYEFYFWDENLDKSIKKCDFDLSLEIEDRKEGVPTKSNKFNGIWSNYNLDGKIDYELKFPDARNSKIKKINYNINGNIESSSFVSCKLISDSILAFHSKYLKDRLTPGPNGEYFYSYNYDYGGGYFSDTKDTIVSPGASRGHNIEINIITSLEDIVEINEI